MAIQLRGQNPHKSMTKNLILAQNDGTGANQIYTILLCVHSSSSLETIDEAYETFKEAICRLREVKDSLACGRFNLLLSYTNDGILLNTIRYYGFDAPLQAVGGWLPTKGDFDFAVDVAKALFLCQN